MLRRPLCFRYLHQLIKWNSQHETTWDFIDAILVHKAAYVFINGTIVLAVLWLE